MGQSRPRGKQATRKRLPAIISPGQVALGFSCVKEMFGLSRAEYYGLVTFSRKNILGAEAVSIT